MDTAIAGLATAWAPTAYDDIEANTGDTQARESGQCTVIAGIDYIGNDIGNVLVNNSDACCTACAKQVIFPHPLPRIGVSTQCVRKTFVGLSRGSIHTPLTFPWLHVCQVSPMCRAWSWNGPSSRQLSFDPAFRVCDGVHRNTDPFFDLAMGQQAVLDEDLHGRRVPHLQCTVRLRHGARPGPDTTTACTRPAIVRHTQRQRLVSRLTSFTAPYKSVAYTPC